MALGGYENKIEELEKIIAMLESGELSLEDSVTIYGEGVKLAAECKKMLDEAKLKISGLDACTEEAEI